MKRMEKLANDLMEVAGLTVVIFLALMTISLPIVVFIAFIIECFK